MRQVRQIPPRPRNATLIFLVFLLVSAAAWGQVKGAPLLVLETGIQCPEGYEAVFSPNGRTLASRAGYYQVALWDAASGRLRRILEHPREGLYSIDSLAWSPDDRTLATGTREGLVRIWDTATGELLHRLAGHRDSVVSVAFSPDGRTLASGGNDGTVRLWDPRGGDLRGILSDVNNPVGNNNVGSVFAVAFSPDGKILASGNSGGTIRLWDLRTQQLLRRLEGHKGGWSPVVFTPDGRTLVSGSRDKTIRLWDPASGASRRTLDAGDMEVYSIAISPDGRRVAGGGFSRNIALWDLRTGGRVSSPPADGSALSVAFAPDGRTIAVGGPLSVRLMDAQTGKLRATLMLLPPTEKGDHRTEWIAFTPEGYFDGSPGCVRFIRWQLGDQRFPGDRYAARFRRPDLLRTMLGANRQ